MSYLLFSSSKSLPIAFEPSISEGFGGNLPDVRIWRFSLYSFTASFIFSLPINTSDNPTKLDILNFLWSEGFLKSQSIKITLFSDWAKDNAILPAVVDLPSPGSELVTTIVFISLSKDEYCILVLKVLYASADIDLGFFSTINI